jgi:hypothetical protein
MSVDDSRNAAAQRTVAIARASARSRRRPWRRLASWVVIVPTLSLFSFSVIAGAQTVGKPDYAGAAKQLPRGKPLIVVTAPAASDESFLDHFAEKSANKELCSVTQSQLARIAAHYTVAHTTITMGGVAVDVVMVSGAGANDHELREYLGQPAPVCKLVRKASVFFLPFDAHGS